MTATKLLARECSDFSANQRIIREILMVGHAPQPDRGHFGRVFCTGPVGPSGGATTIGLTPAVIPRSVFGTVANKIHAFQAVRQFFRLYQVALGEGENEVRHSRCRPATTKRLGVMPAFITPRNLFRVRAGRRVSLYWSCAAWGKPEAFAAPRYPYGVTPKCF